LGKIINLFPCPKSAVYFLPPGSKEKIKKACFFLKKILIYILTFRFLPVFVGEKMADINELIGKLTIATKKDDAKERFKTVINEIAAFYTDSLSLNEHEVGIFLADKEKAVLSFACPEYLVNAGMIPVTSTEAFTASIFRTGRGIIENNIQQQKHLSLFEIIRTPEGKIKLIWKMLGA